MPDLVRTHEPTPRELVAEFDGFCKLMHERDRRYAEKFQASDEKTQLAFASSEKAIIKAESASDKRFDSTNEFRQSVNDIINNCVTKPEFYAKIDAMSEKIEAVRLALSERRGQHTGTTAALGTMITVAGLVALVVFGILNLLKLH